MACNAELRVVHWEDLNSGKIGPIYGGAVPKDWTSRQAFANFIHKEKINYRTVPVYIKYTSTSNMNLSQLLDLGVVLFGEAGTYKGIEVPRDALAHALWNREIKHAKRLANFVGTKLNFNSEPFKVSDCPYGKIAEKYEDGIFAMNLATVHKMKDPIHGDNYPYFYYENVIKGILLVKDGNDGTNAAYRNYNLARKNGIKGLYNLNLAGTPHKSIEEIFGSIIKARLGITKDPYPQADSWKDGIFKARIKDRDGSEIDSETLLKSK